MELTVDDVWQIADAGDQELQLCCASCARNTVVNVVVFSRL